MNPTANRGGRKAYTGAGEDATRLGRRRLALRRGHRFGRMGADLGRRGASATPAAGERMGAAVGDEGTPARLAHAADDGTLRRRVEDGGGLPTRGRPKLEPVGGVAFLSAHMGESDILAAYVEQGGGRRTWTGSEGEGGGERRVFDGSQGGEGAVVERQWRKGGAGMGGSRGVALAFRAVTSASGERAS